MAREILSRNIEGARGVSLLHGNVDAADPGAIHAHMSHNVAALVGHGDVHGLADFLRFLFRSRNHAARVCKVHSCHWSSSNKNVDLDVIRYDGFRQYRRSASFGKSTRPYLTRGQQTVE